MKALGKKILILAGLTSTFAAFALPPDISIEAIRKKTNGQTTLTFKQNEHGESQMFEWTDPNGIATLTTLHYLMIQKPSNDLFDDKMKWDDIKNTNVPEWPSFKAEIIRSIQRYHDAIKDTKVEETKVYKQEAEAMIKMLLPKQELTYEELNKIGEFIQKRADQQFYAEKRTSIVAGNTVVTQSIVPLKASDSNNPVGTALSGRPYTLPPLRLSNSAAIFETDLKRLVREMNQAPLVSQEKGPNPAPASQPSPATHP